MINFFHVKNLTEQTLHRDTAPWDFKLTEVLTAQIRGDKQSRQDWYRNSATQHYFYTLIEPINPNMRVSKDNPPFKLYGFAADYDQKIPDQRVNEMLDVFPFKPAWAERSVGGNLRLIWLLERPLGVVGYDFCKDILEKAHKWLGIGLLPGFDEPAFIDPTRLLCNGCVWRNLGGNYLPRNEVQAFFVKCGRDFRFRPSDANLIPLDVVEKALKEKFPSFAWPSNFSEGSMGPSFWVEGSTSANSAIVKPGGMFTFAAHADKTFYSWADILGNEFVKNFVVDSIANATYDIWFDGQRYWKRLNGEYMSYNEKSIVNFLEVNCRLSPKPGNDGISPVMRALNHLQHGDGRISGAAPFLFQEPGIIYYHGEKKLNISKNRVLQPSPESTPWGPEGKFKWLSAHFDRLFATHEQLCHFLAWFKTFYEAGLLNKPYPGQNVFLMGGVNVGKTLTARQIVGAAMGGFVDASEYLTTGGGFNSQLLESPLWCCDDETMAESPAAQHKFVAMLKKAAANQELQYSKKYEVPCMVQYAGRIINTSNLDYISNKNLNSLDNSSRDKTHLFLCASDTGFVFPDRYEVLRIINQELPYFLRWLLNWKPPTDICIPDPRYGYKAYHHPDLLVSAHQSSKAAPFKEMLIDALRNYFRQNPDVTEWRGSETSIRRLLLENSLNESIVRTLRMEQTSRYLELIQREGILNCTVESSDFQTKIWVFKRADLKMPELPKQPEQTPSSEGKTIFEK